MVSSVATAGETFDDTVVVYTTPRTAGGALAAARYAADAEEYIGCQTMASASGPAQTTCWAQDAAPNYLSCTTSDPNLVASSQAINATSLIYFAANANGDCTALIVSDSSMTMH